MSSESPAEILWVKHITSGKNPPHDGIVKTASNLISQNIPVATIHASSYTLRWLQTVSSPRSRPWLFRLSKTPKRLSNPFTSTLLSPYRKNLAARPTVPEMAAAVSRHGRLGRRGWTEVDPGRAMASATYT